MGWDNNPYYNPEKWGLKIFDSVEREDLIYEFDMFVIWEHEDGRVFWGGDSGCSCPTPFEDVNSLDQLEAGTLAEACAVRDEVLEEWRNAKW
jgi:hypothetical protein